MRPEGTIFLPGGSSARFLGNEGPQLPGMQTGSRPCQAQIFYLKNWHIVVFWG